MSISSDSRQTLHPDSLRALEAIAARRSAGAKVTFVSGNFNIVHPGHLRLLRFAAECGNFLVVGVQPDGAQGTMLPEELRLGGVAATSWVDHAFILRDPAERFVAALRPAVVVKGKEHENRFNPEAEVLRRWGGKLLFSSGDIRFSSLDLLRSEFFQTNPSTIHPPLDFLQRHGIGGMALRRLLERMEGLQVLVLGDLIVDEYITCEALGMSQEDPTIVVTPVMHERFVGGAGIVAAHARGLGARVHYFAVRGRDEAARFAMERLEEYGVSARLYEDENRPTTLKQRYRAAGKTLLRVNHLRQTPVERDMQRRMREEIAAHIDGSDLVVFSDFNYGSLPQPLVDEVCALCRERGVMMVADSQSSSQIGDISRFRGMALITPTEREARLAVQNFSDGLVVLSEELRRKAGADNVLLTLGAEGVLIHAAAQTDSGFYDDRLPAFNRAPRDVAGAGDSLLVGTAMSMAAGGDILASAYLGALAAACQVGRIGNIPLCPSELLNEIDNLP